MSDVNPNAHPGSPSLHYLTVQDILWVNTQVTRQVNLFSYDRLEEGTFYQYGYGGSSDLVAQAGHFFAGLAKNEPFVLGNEATAFVAGLAFLEVNGKTLRLSEDEALGWFSQIRKGAERGVDAVAGRIEDAPHHHPSLKPEVQPAVQRVMEKYPRTIAALVGTTTEPPLAPTA